MLSVSTQLLVLQVPAYRLKLPPKRLFVQNPTPDFVEERRQQLDAYLQMLLQERQLQGTSLAADRCTHTDCQTHPVVTLLNLRFTDMVY